MSEEQAPRSIAEIEQEYGVVCTQLGDVTAHRKMLEHRESALFRRIVELNAEAEQARRAAQEGADR